MLVALVVFARQWGLGATLTGRLEMGDGTDDDVASAVFGYIYMVPVVQFRSLLC